MWEAPEGTFIFVGQKGEKGDTGPQGPKGVYHYVIPGNGANGINH